MLNDGFEKFKMAKNYYRLTFLLTCPFFRYILGLTIIKDLLILFEFTVHFKNTYLLRNLLYSEGFYILPFFLNEISTSYLDSSPPL